MKIGEEKRKKLGKKIEIEEQEKSMAKFQSIS